MLLCAGIEPNPGPLQVSTAHVPSDVTAVPSFLPRDTIWLDERDIWDCMRLAQLHMACVACTVLISDGLHRSASWMRMAKQSMKSYCIIRIRADLYNGLMDAVRADDGVRGNAVGMPIILPSSFVGGARSMREKYQNAMAVVRVKGKPSLFITMTCNPD
ncbi:hypothetical protein WJX77_002234 [Trebouxia sp. C0004]